MEPLHEGRQGFLRLQLGRQGAVHHHRPAAVAPRQGYHPLRVCLRRWGTRLGRHGNDLRQRGEGREGRIENTTPFLFSADETADVGVDDATPVTEDYEELDNEFTGQIEKVTVELKEAT